MIWIRSGAAVVFEFRVVESQDKMSRYTMVLEKIDGT